MGTGLPEGADASLAGRDVGDRGLVASRTPETLAIRAELGSIPSHRGEGDGVEAVETGTRSPPSLVTPARPLVPLLDGARVREEPAVPRPPTPRIAVPPLDTPARRPR